MTKRRDGMYIRKERIENITRDLAKKMTDSKGAGLDYKKTLEYVQLEYGATKKRAAEYLSLIMASQDWRIINEKRSQRIKVGL